MRSRFPLLILSLLATACGPNPGAFTPPAVTQTPRTVTVTPTRFQATIFSGALPGGGVLNVSSSAGPTRTDPTWGAVQDATFNVPAGTVPNQPLMTLFPGCTGSVQETAQGGVTYFTSLQDEWGVTYRPRIEGTTSDGMRAARQAVHVYTGGGGRISGTLTCPKTSTHNARTLSLSATYPAGWSTLMLIEATPRGSVTTDVFLKTDPQGESPTHWVPDGTFR